MESVYATIRSIITPGPSPGERRSSFIVIAGLLSAYPPELLFRPQPFGKGSPASKPFVYLLIQLATIDVRSAFPAILEQLASPSYPATAQRLAAAFDIVVSFLAFLVRAEDFASIGMEPDLLLRLRNDIGEMFGLTLEFLRDRWDAAYTGTLGFEPGHEEGVPKSITWDSTSGDGPEKDVLITSAMRALALWLKEDEGLRTEGGGLMDVFLGLWSKGLACAVDHRSWILGVLEGVLQESHGRAMFREFRGWNLLWDDLKAIANSEQPSKHELWLGCEEARTLASFVRDDRFSNDEWTRDLAATVAGVSVGSGGREKLELHIAILSLASACLSVRQEESAGAFLRREHEQLRRSHQMMAAAVKELGAGGEYRDELNDVLREVSCDLQT